LTFATERFDLVISEDVFEHVRDYRQGFHEVWRVLRFGGAHVFTVPYRAEAPTIDRFARVNGRLVPVMPVEIHYDGLRNGIPAVTTFGYDLVDTLREIGFDTAMCPARADEIKDCRTYMSLSFVSVKRTPGGAGSAGAAAARPREASRR
jgi:SAM-dependent methyltransferase